MALQTTNQNVWGWTTRPTSGFWWLFFSLLGIFIIQTIFQLAQHVHFTTFNEFFGLNLSTIREGHVWQLVSYGFLHQDILHFLLSLFLLYLVSYEVEYEIGIKNFFFLFFTGVLTGGILWLGTEYFRTEHSRVFLMGPGGGIFALIFGFIFMFPDRPMGLLFGLRTKHLGIILTAVVIYFSVFQPSNFANAAQLGGILTGIIYLKILSRQWNIEGPFQAEPGSTAGVPIKKRVTSRTEYINTKVDPVLEKIQKQGVESLTEDEKKILDEARHRLEK